MGGLSSLQEDQDFGDEELTEARLTEISVRIHG